MNVLQINNYYYIYRDSLLATLLDSVRSSGNHHIHVKLSPTPRDKRLIPFNVSPDQEVRWLIQFSKYCLL